MSLLLSTSHPTDTLMLCLSDIECARFQLFSPMDEPYSYAEDDKVRYLMSNSLPNQPEYSLDDWEYSPFATLNTAATPPTSYNSTVHTSMDTWRENGAPQAGFGALSKFDAAFYFHNPWQSTSFASSCQISPREPNSPAPSLGEDVSPPPMVPVKAEANMELQLSQHGRQGFDGSCTSPSTSNVKSPVKLPVKRRASTVSDQAESPETEWMPRKRGRPRINRADTDIVIYGSSSSTSSILPTEQRYNRRLPHNQVERKYRERLNAELDRLRHAVPTLPQRDSNDINSLPKPSKATVLTNAIDYIKSIEIDRARLLEEAELLRRGCPIRPTNPKSRGSGWNKHRSDSVSGSSGSSAWTFSSGDE